MQWCPWCQENVAVEVNSTTYTFEDESSVTTNGTCVKCNNLLYSVHTVMYGIDEAEKQAEEKAQQEAELIDSTDDQR